MDENQVSKFVATALREWRERMVAAEPPSDREIQALVAGELSESEAVAVTAKVMASVRGLARLRELEPVTEEPGELADTKDEGVLVFPVERLHRFRPAGGSAPRLAASDISAPAPMVEEHSEGALRALVVDTRETGLAVEVSRDDAKIWGARVSLYRVSAGSPPERVAQGVSDATGVAELNGSQVFPEPAAGSFYQVVITVPDDVRNAPPSRDPHDKQ